jgi:hypothetical protein
VTAARARGIVPRIGTNASHEATPSTQRRRPSETASSARTTCGSNCSPAQRVISARANWKSRGFLYERTAVMVSNASVTATMRPAIEISCPAMPSG